MPDPERPEDFTGQASINSLHHSSSAHPPVSSYDSLSDCKVDPLASHVRVRVIAAIMYIPTLQSVLTASMALTGTLKKPSEVASGSVMDYAVEKCLDSDGNIRCSKPFLVTKSTCYTVEWKTEGTFTHTTAEVRDAGSDELVFYRDTNGDWTPEKGELVYLDFKPKVPKTGNDTVNYVVKTCE